LWSGVPASTEDRVSRMQQAISRDSRAALSEASEQLAAHWQAGQSTQLLQAYPSYCETLRTFSIDHDLGVFDAGHDSVYTAARSSGLVYKPCGAGGGDVGIVMGHEEAAVDAFADDRDAHGFRRLAVELDDAGVMTTAEAKSRS
jgi:phosphomevalonate kinase